MPWRRALLVWLVLLTTEFVHGAARGLLLAPAIGDWRARQLSVLTGTLLILGIAWLTIRWLGPTSRAAVLGIGALWLVLMVSFEVLFGRYVLQLPWSRIGADYDLRRGGFLSLGMLILAASPCIACRLRGCLPAV